MRFFTTLLVFALLGTTALSAQNEAIRKFIRKHNNGEENVSVTVPGFLIGLAGEIGMWAAEDEEEKAVFTLVQSLGTVRLLTFESSDFTTKKDVTSLLKELERGNEYERWATVRASSGERVELTVRMKRDAVRDLVAIVTDPDEDRTYFIHAKADLTGEQLAAVLKEIE